MAATLYLFGCLLAPAQTPDPPPPPQPAAAARAGERLLGPRLARAQEFVYRGSYDEESAGGRVRFSRSYRFDARVFVLDAPPAGADVAFLTVLRPRDHRSAPAAPGVSAESGVSSARLELARVDLQGRVTPATPGVSLVAPVDGPPTVEHGAFVEIPSGRAAAEGSWVVAEAGRPPRVWRREGTEMVNGTSCVKLVGEQQSEDWEKPRADRGAWRRTDTVWLAPRLGVAFRVERVIQRRDAAYRDATHKAVLRYELDSSLQYPGQLYDDRRQEIVQARSFAEAAAPLLQTPARYGTQLTALLNRINYHVEHQAPTPFREAVLQVRRQVESARRGDTPPATAEERSDGPTVAEVGRPAPDFVATDLTAPGAASARLRDWLGRPVLLVFYNPASPTADDLLRFARGVHHRFNGAVAVAGLSVTDDWKAVRRQHAELGLGFPVLGGGGLRVSYGVETTPRLVLIDAVGVVRGTYLGWGSETPGDVVAELRRCLQHP